MEETDLLKRGKVGVIPTDTLYGLVAVAHDVQAVERVYALKRRDPLKSCIVLIDTADRLTAFGVDLTDVLRTQLALHWPGPVSIALDAPAPAFAHLRRGDESIAFRVPADESLRAFLAVSGPLIAPSANIEGAPPATTIEEARGYFGDDVDFYIDSGMREGLPSTLIKITVEGSVQVLRAGR